MNIGDEVIIAAKVVGITESNNPIIQVKSGVRMLIKKSDISALSENKGEWIKVHSGDKDFPESIVCSKCGNENSHFDFNEHAEPIGKVFVTSKFCPNCGADMRGKDK